MNVCWQFGLYDAVIYIYNNGMMDYITPAEELLNLLAQAQQKTQVSPTHFEFKFYFHRKYQILGANYVKGCYLRWMRSKVFGVYFFDSQKLSKGFSVELFYVLRDCADSYRVEKSELKDWPEIVWFWEKVNTEDFWAHLTLIATLDLIWPRPQFNGIRQIWL